MSMKSIRFQPHTADEEIRAILDNRKTATRRVVRPQPFSVHDAGAKGAKPPYRPGDILYVRETWAKLWYVDANGYTHFDQPMYYYVADGTPDITLYDEDGFELDDQRIRWPPSIHMPREAARIFLRVTDVRVERLQDITITGMRMEGVNRQELRAGGCSCAWESEFCKEWPCSNRHDYEYECWMRPFIEVWDSTIKPADRALYGWVANPWVWVIEFERIILEATS